MRYVVPRCYFLRNPLPKIAILSRFANQTLRTNLKMLIQVPIIVQQGICNLHPHHRETAKDKAARKMDRRIANHLAKESMIVP